MSKKVQEGFFDNVKRYMKQNLDKSLNKKIDALLDDPKQITPGAKKALRGLAKDIDRINQLYKEL
tara:strand:- start:25 stop:219 length:195 start_codon:yes stop_codon:yes gene_type:complete